jgi:hypothetical protein
VLVTVYGKGILPQISLDRFGSLAVHSVYGLITHNERKNTMQKFKELKIGSTFDFISPIRGSYNTFYERCEKISTRKYRDSRGRQYRVGSINCEVFNVSAPSVCPVCGGAHVTCGVLA